MTCRSWTVAMASSSRSNGAASARWSGSMAWVARCTSYRPARKRSPSIGITSWTSCSSSCPAKANIGLATRPSRFAAATSSPRLPARKAHQLINTGSNDLRYLGISTMGGVDVVEYPDSKKIAVAAGVKNADFKTATYVGLGRIVPTDYYDAEDG